MQGGGYHCATSSPSGRGGSGCCNAPFRHQLGFTSSHVIQGPHISDKLAELDQNRVACTDLWEGRHHIAAAHTRRAEYSVANNGSRSCCRHCHGVPIGDPTRGRQNDLKLSRTEVVLDESAAHADVRGGGHHSTAAHTRRAGRNAAHSS